MSSRRQKRATPFAFVRRGAHYAHSLSQNRPPASHENARRSWKGRRMESDPPLFRTWREKSYA